MTPVFILGHLLGLVAGLLLGRALQLQSLGLACVTVLAVAVATAASTANDRALGLVSRDQLPAVALFISSLFGFLGVAVWWSAWMSLPVYPAPPGLVPGLATMGGWWVLCTSYGSKQRRRKFDPSLLVLAVPWVTVGLGLEVFLGPGTRAGAVLPRLGGGILVMAVWITAFKFLSKSQEG